MDNDKTKNSENAAKITCGIRIDGGVGNTFENIRIGGFDVGIQGKGAINNSFRDIHMISARGLEIIASIQSEIKSLQINQNLKEEISNSLTDLINSKDKNSAMDKYTNLMSSLADHVTVLTPVLPLLLQLPTHFI
ncbi:TPA: hypothetical protein RZ058_001057 [Enterobacter cloacae]|nr:hypothetical protein [Enterobacter cloacae]